MADELTSPPSSPQAPSAGVESGSGPSVPSAPASAPPPVTSQGAGASSSPAPAEQPAGSGAGYTPVHEALRSYGYNLPQGLEGHAALQHLLAQVRQGEELSQLAGYGRQYVEHADQFQAFLKQQQAQQEAQQAQKQEWWKAPEFDPSWLAKLYADPQTGEIKALPGADPRLADKYRAWQDHKNKFIDQMAQDPIKAIQPGIEQIASRIAQQMIQQHLGGYQAQQTAQGFVQQHSGWIHQRDEQGNMIVNPQTGRPQLSAWGQRFAGYVQEAEQMGLHDVGSQQKYAMQGVQRDYALYKLQQQTGGGAGPGGAAASPAAPSPNQNFLNRANPPGGTQQVAPAQAQAEPNQPRRKLRDIMMEDFKANGLQASDVLPVG